MNGLNALIARGNPPTYPMPDIMRSYRGALGMKTLQNQLALQQAQMAAQPEEQAWRSETRERQRTQWAQSDEDREFKKEIDALSMAVKADSPREAKAIYESLNPDGAGYDFNFVGNRVELKTVDGYVIEGLKQAVVELLKHFQDNPQWHKDPAIINQVFMRAAGMGVNMRAPEKEEPIETPQEKLTRAKELEKYKAELRPKAEPRGETKISLTMKALKGDQEAINTIESLAKQARETAKETAAGKIEGLTAAIDLEGVAEAVIEGRETIENVRNTFGVPIQETVRKKVLEKQPDFNFVQPRAIYASLRSSMVQQQKNRGMMGSFVRNINKQVDQLETISEDIVKRVGVRALDMPKRELITRFVGSGHERVFEAYMKEVSAEIAKLAQGSAASIAQLPEGNRIEWEKIHDVNLSMNQLMIILAGTRDMANIRLQSVEDELASTIRQLRDVRAPKNLRMLREKPIDELSDSELMELLDAP